jgi:hypothetical protein
LHATNIKHGRLRKKKLRGAACPVIKASGPTNSLTRDHILLEVVDAKDNYDDDYTTNNNNSNNNQCSALFTIYQNMFVINKKCVRAARPE